MLEASRRSGVAAAEIDRSIDAGEIAGFRDGSVVKVRVDELALLGPRSSS